jgi:hypothetical protein
LGHSDLLALSRFTLNSLLGLPKSQFALFFLLAFLQRLLLLPKLLDLELSEAGYLGLGVLHPVVDVLEVPLYDELLVFLRLVEEPCSLYLLQLAFCQIA